jgi:hypothetical protein
LSYFDKLYSDTPTYVPRCFVSHRNFSVLTNRRRTLTLKTSTRLISSEWAPHPCRVHLSCRCADCELRVRSQSHLLARAQAHFDLCTFLSLRTTVLCDLPSNPSNRRHHACCMMVAAMCRCRSTTDLQLGQSPSHPHPIANLDPSHLI